MGEDFVDAERNGLFELPLEKLGWKLVELKQSTNHRAEKYFSDGRWNEEEGRIVRVSWSRLRGPATTDDFVQHVRTQMEQLVTDGRLTTLVLWGGSTDLLFAMSLIDDSARVDEHEIFRVVMRAGSQYTGQFWMRGEGGESERAEWVERLRNAQIVSRKSPPVMVSHRKTAGQDELRNAIIAYSAEPRARDEQALRARVPEIGAWLERCDRFACTSEWSELNFLLGKALAGSSRSDDIERAVVALRRSIQPWRPDRHPELWARNVGLLAQVFIRRSPAADDTRRAIALARSGADAARRAGNARHRATLCYLHGFALTRDLGEAADDALHRAVEVLEEARTLAQALGNPNLWARSTAAVADVKLRLARRSRADLEEEIRHYEEAIEHYEQAIRSGLEHVSIDEEVELRRRLATAREELRFARARPLPVDDIDPTLRAELGKAFWSFPEGIPRRNGLALYLRPLERGGLIVLENRFSLSPAGPILSYAAEPQTISLAGALTRVVWPHIAMQIFGGRVDPFCVMHNEAGDDWRRVVFAAIHAVPRGKIEPLPDPGEEPIVPIVFVVPGDGEGVHDELRELVQQHRLPRCVFVMPPLAKNLDAASLWGRGRAAALKLGLELPEYDPAGRLLRYGLDHRLEDEGPFDLVWRAELMQMIEHLLPALPQNSNDRTTS